MSAYDDIQSITREGMGLLAQSSGLSWATTVDGTYTAFTDGHLQFDAPTIEEYDEVEARTEIRETATLYIPDDGTTIAKGYFVKDQNDDKWAVLGVKKQIGKTMHLLARVEGDTIQGDRGDIG